MPRDRPRRSAPRGQVVLRPDRDKPVKNRHPWVFSGAVDAIADDVADGGVADVVSARGDFLARGYVNRKSQIVARLLTWSERDVIDAGFFRARLDRAVRARSPAGAARMVNAEADGLPGLVVDRYAEVWVVQVSTLGMDTRKNDIVSALEATAHPECVYERSDGEARGKEGLGETVGRLAGEEPPDVVHVAERTFDGKDVVLGVDVKRGHKTGTYLDQSDNRRVVGSLSNGAEVLNLFSYTGAFALHAVAGGAKRVQNVDSSADAIALSELNAAENGSSPRIAHLQADVFEAIRTFRDAGTTFDVVIADPPKLAASTAHVERAARAYKDLNRIAMTLVRPGGYLATFSCSGLVSTDLFQKIVWSASLEAAREARIVRRLGQAPDHPVLLSFPEGEYLKGLVCRID